ncbi:MAG TPA: hypothetical protein VI279_01220 [Rhodocyclaceae bacterium]
MKRKMHYSFVSVATLLFLVLPGCAIERAQTAAVAQVSMVGMQKDAVLACMGIPQSKSVEGSVEVWSYGSGDGRTDTFSTANSNTTTKVAAVAAAANVGPATVAAGSATANSQTDAHAHSMSKKRSCTVNVVMTDGRVSRVNYQGPTGGLLTKGEQCAYAIENCVK